MKETSCSSILQSIIGEEKMEEVCEALKGMRVYIPEKPLPQDRDTLIRAELSELADVPKMTAYKIIAHKHNISERWVRKVAV